MTTTARVCDYGSVAVVPAKSLSSALSLETFLGVFPCSLRFGPPAAQLHALTPFSSLPIVARAGVYQDFRERRHPVICTCRAYLPAFHSAQPRCLQCVGRTARLLVS
jgi:hypothetical protein